MRKFLIASAAALFLCVASVGLAQSRAKERKITDRDVFLHFRLDNAEELPKRAGDACSGAETERLECRSVALELVNQSSQTLHLFHMSCGDEFSVEQQLPDGKWQSTQVPAGPGIDDLEMCGRNFPIWESVPAGGKLTRVFRINWLGRGAVSLVGSNVRVRAVWGIAGCIGHNAPGQDCWPKAKSQWPQGFRMTSDTLLLKPVAISAKSQQLQQTTRGEATASRQAQITGDSALRLISLLASGNGNAAKMLDNAKSITVHDLWVYRASTFKYDSDAPLYKVEIYSATGKVGDSNASEDIGEATTLFELLSKLGFEPETSLGSWEHVITKIECKVDVKLDNSAPERFRCGITSQ